MLFRRATLEAIERGEVTVAFRRWRRPTVRAGGTLTTAAGVLAIDEVTVIEPDDVTDADARAAGHADATTLLADLPATEHPLHRVRFHVHGPDPRIARREDADLDAAAIAELRDRLARADARAEGGPWTAAVLAMIAAHPGRRAPDLAAAFGHETLPFKRRVRTLKELGLTESLPVGYRLSPRGEALLAHLPTMEPPTLG